MDKVQKRNRRKKAIRKKVFGTLERPRMTVCKSNRNICVQIINDVDGKTICSVTTVNSEGKDKTIKTKKNINFGGKVGEKIAKIAIEKGVKKVVLDRAGYKYHGVVKTIADAARKGGLDF